MSYKLQLAKRKDKFLIGTSGDIKFYQDNKGNVYRKDGKKIIKITEHSNPTMYKYLVQLGYIY